MAAGQMEALTLTVKDSCIYLLAVVEEEQSGISSHAVLRANLIVLCTVHLDRKYMNGHKNVTVNTEHEQIYFARVCPTRQ